MLGLLKFSKLFAQILSVGIITFRAAGKLGYPTASNSFIYTRKLSSTEVKRFDECQALEPELIYSSFHYITRPPVKHPTCTELTPKAPETWSGTGLRLSPGQTSQSLLSQTAVTLSQRVKAKVKKHKAQVR